MGASQRCELTGFGLSSAVLPLLAQCNTSRLCSLPRGVASRLQPPSQGCASRLLASSHGSNSRFCPSSHCSAPRPASPFPSDSNTSDSVVTSTSVALTSSTSAVSSCRDRCGVLCLVSAPEHQQIRLSWHRLCYAHFATLTGCKIIAAEKVSHITRTCTSSAFLCSVDVAQAHGGPNAATRKQVLTRIRKLATPKLMGMGIHGNRHGLLKKNPIRDGHQGVKLT
jgi:hypothetical protein